MTKDELIALAVRFEKHALLLRKTAEVIDRPDAPSADEPIDRKSGLSVRARKACMRLGANCVRLLAEVSYDDLLWTKNCGPHTIREIRAFLNARGLRLKGDVETE